MWKVIKLPLSVQQPGNPCPLALPMCCVLCQNKITWLRSCQAFSQLINCLQNTERQKSNWSPMQGTRYGEVTVHLLRQLDTQQLSKFSVQVPSYWQPKKYFNYTDPCPKGLFLCINYNSNHFNDNSIQLLTNLRNRQLVYT